MMTSREQRIRMLAYRIWESEGRPEGQEARHWEMAVRIVEAENAREEEQEWQGATDEPSPLEGEEPPAEPDELGIDEQRLPLDDPETEARKEEDTGVEVSTSPSATSKRASATTASKTAKPATARRTSTRASSGEKKTKETRSTQAKTGSRKAPATKDEADTDAKPAGKSRTPRNKSE